MRLSRTYSLAEIAELVGESQTINGEVTVTGLNEINQVEQGDIVFVDHPKYYQKTIESAAVAVIINTKDVDAGGKGLLVVDDPLAVFNQMIEKLEGDSYANRSRQISETANVHPSCQLSDKTVVGKNSILHPNVTTVGPCTIGDNVIIHSGTVLGADAFYFQKREAGYEKLRSCGEVVIEDNVEIGANCTIDRGVSGITRIGRGSKIDNLVQIAHDTQFGEHCLVAAQTGISGCVKIGNNVTIWGQVGITARVTIEDNVTVYAQSGVNRTLEKNGTYLGSPADDARTKWKEIVAVKALPNQIKKI